MSGVTIALKGSNTKTFTNNDGQFSIAVPEGGNPVLLFSSVGYKTQEVPVGLSSTINVTMATSADALNEVIVIGYGTVRKKDLTGAVASVSGKTISATPVTNVAQAMQGKLAGVSIVSKDDRPDADVSIRVRGGGS
ncbi:MAG: carboxypeptidase-like regulatory domain-containing protein, partial [Flavisolibacter sp.]|nr:carboxypeptidase-like regulatory domain-containing protein [Flavisolibacter sp.]